MPRVCTICQHAHRAEIDTALVGNVANRRIAAQFSVTEQAIRRHKAEHLPGAMVKAQEEQDVRHAIDIVQQLKAINTVCWQVLQDAHAANDRELVLKASDRVVKHIELQAKLLGELEQEGATTIVINQQVQAYTAILMRALAPWPDARAVVAAALEAHDAG